MKNILLIGTCVACMGWPKVMNAQSDGNVKNGSGMEQMIEKRAEKMADNLELKGDSRSSFLTTYEAYQQELMKHRAGDRPATDTDAKKETELTEEEAAARIQAEFDRKTQQVVDLYNRLEVDKKYYELFSKTLSAKQMMKIFAPVRMPRGRGNAGRMKDEREGNPFGGQRNGFPQGGGFDGGEDW
ncbi:MAG: hypothetical protein LUC45_00265 [Paraprevotella sp.]|nr:hypothetical protein [Paraprevotella sp.]